MYFERLTKEILGPVHIVGIALIVVGVVVLNLAPAIEEGVSEAAIHRTSAKADSPNFACTEF